MIEDRWYYEQMLRIRRFEETVLEEFKRGVFTGTTHTYLGQEANAVALLSLMMPMDVVVSNHRCHGHFLAYGGDPRALFAELMGTDTGVCGGAGRVSAFALAQLLLQRHSPGGWRRFQPEWRG